MKVHAFVLAAGLMATPSLAQDPLAPLPIDPQPTVPAPVVLTPPTPIAPTPPEPVVLTPPAPVVLTPPTTTAPAVATVRIPRDWREVFSAIRGSRWAEAQAGIAVLPRSILTPVAQAELYTAKGSPVVPLDRLQSLLAAAPDLPKADQIARLATTRGALTPPAYYQRRPTVWLGNAPSRQRARPVSGDPAADALRTALDPLIKSDAAVDAELLLMQALPTLSFEARAEAAQRVAWAYYALQRDQDARRVADTYRVGATGEWANQATWVSALASWRLGDCNSASARFQEVASTAVQRELSAAGYYWAARAEQSCRRPQSVARLLKAAARSPESFYGLLARETLGTSTALPPEAPAQTYPVDSLANVQRAVELVRIGEIQLAEEMLRHQAQIGRPTEHRGLIDTARHLNLAGAQYWLAHNGQQGASASARDRYPVPSWNPARGWRIDPALALAHMRQESSFRFDALSPAGAVGLMQVLPSTAAAMARANGMPPPSNLYEPTVNIELGQSFIERVRSSGATQGQLPKVIAAYNAGPLPVARWAYLPGSGDPLLWIESIPYYETRQYVPAVMRNLWVYQGITNSAQPTLRDLAQHRWPAVPTNRIALASADDGGPSAP